MSERLATDGGTPVRSTPFPSWPIFDEREERMLLDVLHSGHWGEITGDKVASFARQFAEFQGARFGVCVPNGTLALEMALEALGLGDGDEVITTPFTFIATAGAVLTVGAKPVFVDIDPQTFNIDPDGIEGAITARTKAVVPVHLAGLPADMDAVLDIARQHGLHILEDACQAWGAQWRGQGVGTIGNLGTFSFQASKNLTAGEGGIVVTNDETLYERCWSLHNVGRIPDGAWYQHEILGRNLRMSEWEAAVLLAQLERVPHQMQTRERNARYLHDALREDLVGITPARVDPRVTRHAYHLFQLRYAPDAFGGRTRDEFVAALQAEGIAPCTAGYVPLTHAPALLLTLESRFGPTAIAEIANCPNAEQAAAEVVWLHQNILLGDQSDMDDIVAAMRKIQHAWGG